MKVRVENKYGDKTLNVDKVWFSSDLHLNHEAVIKFGRKFPSVDYMNYHIIEEINTKVGENDLLVLLGDTMMGEKDYITFLNRIFCKNVILLKGNHCNLNKLMDATVHPNLFFVSDYLELRIGKQFISCSHYPLFN